MAALVDFPYLDMFQMLHSIAAYYKSDAAKPFQCIIENIYYMIPNTSPVKLLFYEAIQVYPLSAADLADSSSVLRWTYKINMYVHKQLYNQEFTNFDAFRKKYTPENILMSTWSHPTWKMIHFYGANYNPEDPDYAISYKAFISCLQYLVPCKNCREHLRANLADHPIDQFFASAEDLFTWGYILHQTVSVQTKKQGISLSEAKKLYGLRE